MESYKKINLWNFPLTKTFVRIHNKYRFILINEFIKRFGKEPLAVDFINRSSVKYGLKRKFSRGVFYCWRNGFIIDSGKRKTKNIPLWVIIEISKILSKTDSPDNKVMRMVSQNIEYYCSIGGANRVYKPKIPILITPEFVSIVFHFCGDGHMSFKPGSSSSYAQINKDTLKMVYDKLKNCFGDFKFSLSDDAHLHIPKMITYIYSHYFDITTNNWYDARIPVDIMELSKPFLLAGLVSFIIDEANIGEVIEIYSKNYDLINDVRKVGIKCGYKCRKIKKKYRYGIFDSYRFLISSDSYLDLHNDILNLQKKFPLCSLAHKTKRFEILVRRKQRNQNKGKDKVTKNKISNILTTESKSTFELAELLNIGPSSVREHLWKLEKEGGIVRIGQRGRNILWSSK